MADHTIDTSRRYTFLDQCLINIDQGLKTLFNVKRHAKRACPGAELVDKEFSAEQRRHIAGLMRVNHAGEVCAQALYQGQALTARLQNTRQKMEQSAEEEIDHLVWCEQRLIELEDHTSYLNFLWYTGSLLIGSMAGLIGDQWSLGFVVETERQVVKHLSKHLQRLPRGDRKSHAILEQMIEDEARHATVALSFGAYELPSLVKEWMRFSSKIMTRVAYLI